jgi:hypothetical protein
MADIWIVEDFVSNFKATESSAEFPHTFFVSENNNNESFVNYSDTSSLIIQLGYILHSAVRIHHFYILPLFPYSPIPLFPYSPIPLFLYSSIPLFLYSSIPLFLCLVQALFKIHSKLRVVALVRDDMQVADETARLNAFLYKCRVKAETKVFINSLAHVTKKNFLRKTKQINISSPHTMNQVEPNIAAESKSWRIFLLFF